ncbi:MAG: hypothetical protein Q9204_004486 [Flavoplaca sp. TL-2023a]
MGVPFEALLPGVIIMGLMGITGAGMSTIRAMQNGGKRGRHSVDQWDRVSKASTFIMAGADADLTVV